MDPTIENESEPVSVVEEENSKQTDSASEMKETEPEENAVEQFGFTLPDSDPHKEDAPQESEPNTTPHSEIEEKEVSSTELESKKDEEKEDDPGNEPSEESVEKESKPFSFKVEPKSVTFHGLKKLSPEQKPNDDANKISVSATTQDPPRSAFSFKTEGLEEGGGWDQPTTSEQNGTKSEDESTVQGETEKQSGWGDAQNTQQKQGGWGDAQNTQQKQGGWGDAQNTQQKQSGLGDAQNTQQKQSGWGDAQNTQQKQSGWGDAQNTQQKQSGWGDAQNTQQKQGWGDAQKIQHGKFDTQQSGLVGKMESLGPPSSGLVEAGEGEPLTNRLLPDAFDSKLEVQQNDPTNPLYSVLDFDQMNLSPDLLKGIYAAKFQKPSKIQSTALPMILADPPQNLIGQAQSGTGKTAAFVLGMLSRVDTSLKQPQALCIAPTRELVRQIYSVADKLGQFTGVSLCRLIKDIRFPMSHRITDQLIVGTAGRVFDLINRRILPVRFMKIFVLDEADVMMEMQGMGDQSIRIKSALPECQLLLFSATFKPEVRKFALRVIKNPSFITLKREQLSLEGIKQFYVECGDYGNKISILSDLYGYMTIGQSIIFVHTRRTATELADRMRQMGHQVSILHGGDMEGEERDTVIDDFRNGKSKVLITTNVLSRGIDILQVSLVINYDLPVYHEDNSPDPETYLHRIGRSGRFGRKGTAINLVHDERSLKALAFFAEYFHHPIERIDLENIEKLDNLI